MKTKLLAPDKMKVTPIDLNAIVVLKCDREAMLNSGYPLSQFAREAIRYGEWDHHYLVQAFARYRLSNTCTARVMRFIREALPWTRN